MEVFRTKKSNSSYTPSSKNTNKQINNNNLLLPNNIASRILDIQLQIQSGNINKEIVMELLDLYSQATEFYEQKNNQKYKLYQQKIQNVVSKPQINMVLNNKPVTAGTIPEIKMRQVLQVKKDAQRSIKQQAKTIIKFYNVELQKQANRIENQLQKQKKKILQRVKSRSLSKNKINNQNPENQKSNVINEESIVKQQKIQGLLANKNCEEDVKMKMVLDALEGLKSYEKKNTKKTFI